MAQFYPENVQYGETGKVPVTAKYPNLQKASLYNLGEFATPATGLTPEQETFLTAPATINPRNYPIAQPAIPTPAERLGTSLSLQEFLKQNPGYQFEPLDTTGVHTTGAYMVAPTEATVAKVLPTGGEYITDPTQPGKIIRSARNWSYDENVLIRNGLNPALYQIDHIYPLWVGGANTLLNREILRNDEHDLKTKSQAVPLTLLGAGLMTPEEAATEAMNWKGRDVSGIKVLKDDGTIDVNLAKQILNEWKTHPGEPGLAGKNVWEKFTTILGSIPPKAYKTAGNFYHETMLGGQPEPDELYLLKRMGKSFLRALPFMNALVPELSIPDRDLSKEDWPIRYGAELEDRLGGLAGFAASWAMLNRFLGPIFGTILKAPKIATTATEVANALKGTKMVSTLAKTVTKAGELVTPVVKTATDPLGITFKRTMIDNAIKSGGLFILLGQTQMPFDAEPGDRIKQGIVDAIFGGMLGQFPYNLRGVVGITGASAMLSLMGQEFATGEVSTSDALMDGVTMGILHSLGYTSTKNILKTLEKDPAYAKYLKEKTRAVSKMPETPGMLRKAGTFVKTFATPTIGPEELAAWQRINQEQLYRASAQSADNLRQRWLGNQYVKPKDINELQWQAEIIDRKIFQRALNEGWNREEVNRALLQTHTANREIMKYEFLTPEQRIIEDARDLDSLFDNVIKNGGRNSAIEIPVRIQQMVENATDDLIVKPTLQDAKADRVDLANGIGPTFLGGSGIKRGELTPQETLNLNEMVKMAGKEGAPVIEKTYPNGLKSYIGKVLVIPEDQTAFLKKIKVADFDNYIGTHFLYKDAEGNIRSLRLPPVASEQRATELKTDWQKAGIKHPIYPELNHVAIDKIFKNKGIEATWAYIEYFPETKRISFETGNPTAFAKLYLTDKTYGANAMQMANIIKRIPPERTPMTAEEARIALGLPPRGEFEQTTKQLGKLNLKRRVESERVMKKLTGELAKSVFNKENVTAVSQRMTEMGFKYPDKSAKAILRAYQGKEQKVVTGEAEKLAKATFAVEKEAKTRKIPVVKGAVKTLVETTVKKIKEKQIPPSAKKAVEKVLPVEKLPKPSKKEIVPPVVEKVETLNPEIIPVENKGDENKVESEKISQRSATRLERGVVEAVVKSTDILRKPLLKELSTLKDRDPKRKVIDQRLDDLNEFDKQFEARKALYNKIKEIDKKVGGNDDVGKAEFKKWWAENYDKAGIKNPFTGPTSNVLNRIYLTLNPRRDRAILKLSFGWDPTARGKRTMGGEMQVKRLVEEPSARDLFLDVENKRLGTNIHEVYTEVPDGMSRQINQAKLRELYFKEGVIPINTSGNTASHWFGAFTTPEDFKKFTGKKIDYTQPMEKQMKAIDAFHRRYQEMQGLPSDKITVPKRIRISGNKATRNPIKGETNTIISVAHDDNLFNDNPSLDQVPQYRNLFKKDAKWTGGGRVWAKEVSTEDITALGKDTKVMDGGLLIPPILNGRIKAEGGYYGDSSTLKLYFNYIATTPDGKRSLIMIKGLINVVEPHEEQWVREMTGRDMHNNDILSLVKNLKTYDDNLQKGVIKLVDNKRYVYFDAPSEAWSFEYRNRFTDEGKFPMSNAGSKIPVNAKVGGVRIADALAKDAEPWMQRFVEARNQVITAAKEGKTAKEIYKILDNYPEFNKSNVDEELYEKIRKAIVNNAGFDQVKTNLYAMFNKIFQSNTMSGVQYGGKHFLIRMDTGKFYKADPNKAATFLPRKGTVGTVVLNLKEVTRLFGEGATEKRNENPLYGLALRSPGTHITAMVKVRVLVSEDLGMKNLGSEQAMIDPFTVFVNFQGDADGDGATIIPLKRNSGISKLATYVDAYTKKNGISIPGKLTPYPEGMDATTNTAQKNWEMGEKTSAGGSGVGIVSAINRIMKDLTSQKAKIIIKPTGKVELYLNNSKEPSQVKNFKKLAGTVEEDTVITPHFNAKDQITGMRMIQAAVDSGLYSDFADSLKYEKSVSNLMAKLYFDGITDETIPALMDFGNVKRGLPSGVLMDFQKPYQILNVQKSIGGEMNYRDGLLPGLQDIWNLNNMIKKSGGQLGLAQTMFEKLKEYPLMEFPLQKSGVNQWMNHIVGKAAVEAISEFGKNYKETARIKKFLGNLEEKRKEYFLAQKTATGIEEQVKTSEEKRQIWKDLIEIYNDEFKPKATRKEKESLIYYLLTDPRGNFVDEKRIYSAKTFIHLPEEIINDTENNLAKTYYNAYNKFNLAKVSEEQKAIIEKEVKVRGEDPVNFINKYILGKTTIRRVPYAEYKVQQAQKIKVRAQGVQVPVIRTSITAKYAKMTEAVGLITRAQLKQNSNKIYLFGDNLQGTGLGGQAKEMRGEPNAIGIPTKKKPTMEADAFFIDAEFAQNKKAIDSAFAKIPPGKEVVIPDAGIGTGLAQLETKAPQTFKYLQDKLNQLRQPIAGGALPGYEAAKKIKKTPERITTEILRPELTRRPGPTKGSEWLQQNPGTKSVFGQMAREGHQIEWLVKEGAGKTKPVQGDEYLGKVIIDKKEYTSDEARAKFIKP